jgi:hypothetical protein
MTPEDALRAWLDAHPARPTPVKSDAELDYEDYWASVGEDRAFMAKHGGTDEEADYAAGMEENRVTRSLEKRGLA